MKEKPLWKIVGNGLLIHLSAVMLCLIFGLSLLCLSQSLPIQIISSLFCVVIYWGVINKPAWKLGNDDHNRVKFGHKEEDLFRGFKVGLLVGLPFLIMALLLILSKLGYFPDFYMFYKVVNGQFLPITNFLDGTYMSQFCEIQFGYDPYVGLQHIVPQIASTVSSVSWWQMIGICALTLVTPLFYGIGYIIGYKDIVLVDRIIYKNGKKRRRG